MLLYLLLLLIPAMMIGCGLRWRRKPPKYPKHQDTVFGGIFFIDYRTEWAMKSIETWNYSHICYGRMMLPIGIVAMVFSDCRNHFAAADDSSKMADCHGYYRYFDSILLD